MLGRRTRRQTVVVDFDKAAKPHALAVMDMAEGAENAGMGCAEIAIELVEGQRQTGIEQLTSGPGRVARLHQQKLFERRHKPKL